MVMHLYMARRFTIWVLGTALALGGITFLLDLVSLAASLKTASLGTLIKVSLLATPRALYAIMPLIMLLGSAGFCMSISRSSELTAARASGLSLLRTALGPALSAWAIAMAILAVGNPLIASTTKLHDRILAQLSETANQSFVASRGNGLWLRESRPEGQMVIFGINANGQGTLLHRATFMLYEGDTPAQRIEVRNAELAENGWLLEDAKIWSFSERNPEAKSSLVPKLQLGSTLTPAGIADNFGDPDTISIWTLPAFIQRLNEAGFSALRHRSWFASECTAPIFLLAMVLIAAGCTMRHHRKGGSGSAVLAALGLGFGLYFLRRMAMILGENGQLPVIFAATIPAFAALLLGIVLIIYREDAG